VCCNPWPGRGVGLVILSGNHSSQDSPITGCRGLAQNVPNEPFAIENRVAACRRARGAQPLPRGSVSFHVLLRRGDTLVGPLREARECTRGPRSPGSGAPTFLAWAVSCFSDTVLKGPPLLLENAGLLLGDRTGTRGPFTVTLAVFTFV
jgi:hypothetical protein